MAAAHGRLVRTLYRGLWRATKALEQHNPTADARSALLSHFVLPGGLPRTGATSLTAALKHQFLVHRKYPAKGEDTKELVELAFTALRQANKRVAAVDAPASAATTSATATGPAASATATASPPTAVAVPKPDAVHFSIGQVVRHRNYGYKAVIVGWHASCKASARWVEANGIASLPHGADQPFYTCLVDVRDRPEAQVCYIAQDNIQLLTDCAALTGAGAGAAPTDATAKATDRLVVHPLVLKHFLSYNAAAGYYVPCEELADAYPHDVPAAVLPAVAAASATAASAGGARRQSELSRAAAIAADILANQRGGLKAGAQ